MADITIRDLVPSDEPFIKSSWLRCYQNSPWAGLLPSEAYFILYRPIIEYLYTNAKISVAVNPDETETGHEIWGYAVHEPGVMHWVYVKDGLRGHGIARALYEASGLETDFKYTFLTVAGNKALSKLNKAGKLNTYHAYSLLRKRDYGKADK